MPDRGILPRAFHLLALAVVLAIQGAAAIAQALTRQNDGRRPHELPDAAIQWEDRARG